jgi:hypothetical protein
MAALDRGELIELLERLGADSDATVLDAARALHRKAAEAGQSWDDIIRPASSFDERPDDESSAAAEPDPDTADVARLIERLMRRGVSEELRGELAEMRRQIAAGSLDAEDARYVRALARRLGV